MNVTKYWLAPGTMFATPYYIVKSSVPGIPVIVTAGVHGNEPASVRAAGTMVDMLRHNRWKITRGSLLIVPLVNQEACKLKIRGNPDLNRTFPRGPQDAAGHPLTAALYTLAVNTRPAWYLDLHEANGLSRLHPKVLGQTLITHPGSMAIPAARRVAASMNLTVPRRERHFGVRLRGLPGSGRHAAFHLLHSKAVTVETSWSLPMSDRVSYQLEIVRKLLQEAGLVPY